MTATVTAPVTAAREASLTTTAAPSLTVTTGPTPTAPTTTAPAPTTAAVVAPAPPVPTTPTHGAVYSGGKLTLSGRVPDRATADAFVAKAGAVVGPANVIDRYVIDPTAPPARNGLVRVQEQILFRTGSADLDPQFRPTIDLAVLALRLNTHARMTVVGHTDSVGDPVANQALSLARARAVVAYMAAAGIGPARLTAEGHGADEPIADNATADGRSANRRIEVTFVGLLDG